MTYKYFSIRIFRELFSEREFLHFSTVIFTVFAPEKQDGTRIQKKKNTQRFEMIHQNYNNYEMFKETHGTALPLKLQQ